MSQPSQAKQRSRVAQSITATSTPISRNLIGDVGLGLMTAPSAPNDQPDLCGEL
jgi:hypothetical protein